MIGDGAVDADVLTRRGGQREAAARVDEAELGIRHAERR